MSSTRVVVVALLTVCFGAAFCPEAAASLDDRLSRPGTALYALSLPNFAEVWLDGFTLQGADQRGVGASYAGALWIRSASPTIQNNTFVSNFSPMGGAIVCRYSGSLDTAGQVVRPGAAIKFNAIGWNDGGDRGGGIYCEGGCPQIEHNAISYNRAFTGGGIACRNGCRATIDGNSLEHNTAYYSGGGLSLWDRCHAYVVNNLFIENEADALDYTGGGGVYTRDSQPAIVNNTFAGNSADAGCGGAVLADQESDLSAEAALVNNVFSGNTASYGSSVAATNWSQAEVHHCDALPAVGAYYADVTSQMTFGDVCLNLPADFCGTGPHPYWLQLGSQVRGCGLNPGGGNSVPGWDKDARLRPGSNGTTDMGAYEDNPACD